MPTAALLRIWLALDRDGSGQLCVGECGAFMSLGLDWTREKAPGAKGRGELKTRPPPATALLPLAPPLPGRGPARARGATRLSAGLLPSATRCDHALQAGTPLHAPQARAHSRRM